MISRLSNKTVKVFFQQLLEQISKGKQKWGKTVKTKSKAALNTAKMTGYK